MANLDTLVLDLLEWVGPDPRPYDEVMAAWRTSCPGLPVWEEAHDRGFLERRHEDGQATMVAVTPAGREHLERSRPGSFAGVAAEQDDVVVVTVQGPFAEANVRAFLGAQGIETRTSRHTVPQVPMVVDGLGAVSILVRADQASEARELLARVERGEMELPEDEDAAG